MSRFRAPARQPRVEREITEEVDLARPDGRLDPRAVGWSRTPRHRCRLPRPWGRRKRWDYWCVTTDRHLFSLTYAHLDYLGLASAWFLDFESGRSLEKVVGTPFGLGFHPSDEVAGDDLVWAGLGLRLEVLEEPGGTRLAAGFRQDGVTVDAEILVELPDGHETLGVVVPWGPRRYQYTSKHNTRPASGSVRVGPTEYPFGPDDGAFGTLDFGRGVWPYRSTWNWASASGREDERTVGLQFGGKWTDGTGSTENALCLDGRLHKIGEDLIWDYDRDDFRRPWAIRSPLTDRVDVTFTPFYERAARFDALVLASDVHQCFGHFAGSVRSEEGERIEVDGLLGWAEEARWRW